MVRHGESCRGAIVLVASDGWDTDPPEAMVAAMARLRRRAHRVVWLNPRWSAPGYAPLVGGLAAALPHCDVVLPADTIRALGDVVAAITGGV
ncbi:MAG: VWA domain-containing protein [Acidimicrobiales bacterium]